MKKPPIGSGPRYHNLVAQLSRPKQAADPKALASAVTAAKQMRQKMRRAGH